ncbi:MAG TPA: glycosyltransferase family 4 protein [Bryobacteraceae bacterium]|nr:glycosyltransferase family 4 protein [Bryobacteraceae bacterium]
MPPSPTTPDHPATLLYVDNSLATFLSHRLALARQIARQGYRIHVAAPPDTSPHPLEAAGFQFHPLFIARASLSPWNATYTILKLVSIYRHVQPDLIHHLRLKPILYGELASRITGARAVINSLTGLGFAYCDESWCGQALRAVVRATLRATKRPGRRHFTFQNEDDFALWRKQGICGRQDSSIVPGSGIDVTEHDVLPEPPSPPVVVLPSRFLWHKGISDFVEAARVLQARGCAARFALVGRSDPGNPGAIPPRTIDAWVASGAVENWGWSDGMRSVFSRCHIVCLPSYREGIPRVLLEASLAGRAIVTTDTPGCRDVVVHGQSGLLVPPKDAESLAEALSLLLNGPALRERCAAEARRRTIERFSLDAVVARTLDLYDCLLEPASEFAKEISCC